MTSNPNLRPTARVALALFAALFASVAAQASEVSFSGGFTSFRGPVATGPGELAAVIHTDINGVTVYADRALPGGEYGLENFGLGLKDTYSLTGAGGIPTPSVTFDRIFYSAPNPNIIAFMPSGTLDLRVGSTFSVGSFSVTNGAWFGNSSGGDFYPHTDIGFSVTTHSSDPRLDGFTFSDTLRFVVTAGDTIEQDADYFYFLGHPELGTISVFESRDPEGNPLALGNTGTVEFQVRIGSLLPVAFANPDGATFIGDQVSAVPEPSAALLWLGGMAALGFGLRQARRGPSPVCR